MSKLVLHDRPKGGVLAWHMADLSFALVLTSHHKPDIDEIVQRRGGGLYFMSSRGEYPTICSDHSCCSLSVQPLPSGTTFVIQD